MTIPKIAPDAKLSPPISWALAMAAIEARATFGLRTAGPKEMPKRQRLGLD